MRIEKSNQSSKTADYSMVTNKIDQIQTNLNSQSCRSRSFCANKKSNLTNAATILKSIAIALCTILSLLLTTQNNYIYAETLSVSVRDATDSNGNLTTIDAVTRHITVNFIEDTPGQWTPEQRAAVLAAFKNMFEGVFPGESGLGLDTGPASKVSHVYDIKWGDTPQGTVSTNKVTEQHTTDDPHTWNTIFHHEIIFNPTAKDDFSTMEKGQLMREQRKPDGSTFKYNLFVQTIHELTHLLKFDSGINAAQTGFDLTNNAYRNFLRNYDGSNSTPPYPGFDFNSWNTSNGVWFEGSMAFRVFNDRDSGNNSSHFIPIGSGGSSYPSPDAVLNHIDQTKLMNIMGTDTFPIMSWNLPTVNTRPFLTELELAMLYDAGAFELNPDFTLRQHFGRSIYQKEGTKDNPLILNYNWNQNDLENRVKDDYYEYYIKDVLYGAYVYDVARYGIGLHVVSSGNFLAYEGQIVAGDRLGYKASRSPAAYDSFQPSGEAAQHLNTSQLKPYFRHDYASNLDTLKLLTSFSAGIRIEGQNNYISILDASEVEGQFGVLIAAGSNPANSIEYQDNYGLNLNSNTILINHGEIRSLKDYVLVEDYYSTGDPLQHKDPTGVDYYGPADWNVDVLKYHPDDKYDYDSDSFNIIFNKFMYDEAPQNYYNPTDTGLILNDNNYFRAGIYLEAGASEVNMVGNAKLYNGIYIDEGAELRNGMNLMSNLEHPEYEIELHGNFINHKYNEKFTPAVITAGKKANADHDGPQKTVEDYTIQWIDAYKENKLIVAIYDNTGKWIKNTTGYYKEVGNVTLLVTDEVDADGEAYHNNQKYKIDPIKINSGIETPTDVVANIFADFHGNWQFESWGGTTNFYIPNIRIYASNNITHVTNTNNATIGYPSDYVQIDYSAVKFYIGADDKGASNLEYTILQYDPDYREQGSFSIVHLSEYNEEYDIYDKYYYYDIDYPGVGYSTTGMQLSVETSPNPDLDFDDDALYIFDEVKFGSKNNVGSVFEGNAYYDSRWSYTYDSNINTTVSVIIKGGIDNWITIKDFYRVEAVEQPDQILRIWKDKNLESGINGLDFAQAIKDKTLLQGFFRLPNILPYLNDREHLTEINDIFFFESESLVADILGSEKPNTLGEISIFNRYSGIIKDNAHVVAKNGIWVDRDEAENFEKLYGQLINNDYIEAGTFIENYGRINDNGPLKHYPVLSGYYNDMQQDINDILGTKYDLIDFHTGYKISNGIWAGTYIYNAFGAEMNNNWRIESGKTTDEELRKNSYLYIVNGGQMNNTWRSVVAETDLINLITGEINDTKIAVIAKRDIYNFGKIYNTAASELVSNNPQLPDIYLQSYDGIEDYYNLVLKSREIDGGIYTLDGSLYNFNSGELFGNRHIIIRSETSGQVAQHEGNNHHKSERLNFGTSGHIVNAGQIGYTFGLEKRYNASSKTSELLLASIETEYDLINFSAGDIFDTTYISVGGTLYNENSAKIRNTAYLDVNRDLVNRDFALLYNTSYAKIMGDLYNEGNAVIDTGTHLQVWQSLRNGVDDIFENGELFSHLATIKNFATIEVNNGNLVNGKYGLITANNKILAKQPVNNKGIIEKFFDFTIKQSLTNDDYGIIDVIQGSNLNVASDIINKDKGRFFAFGNVTAAKVENTGYVHGTGTITLTGKNGKNVFNNLAGGHLSPGGATVLHPATVDDITPSQLTYGNDEIGKLTIIGNLQNAHGSFDITINPQSSDRPIDGNAGDNDIIYVQKIRDANGADLGGGKATIDGGEVHPYLYSNDRRATLNPARYIGGTKIIFLTTETGLTVNTELQEATYTDENQLNKKYTEDILLFDFILGHDDYSYWFTVDRKYKYGAAGKTRNQRSLGQYIDKVSENPNPKTDFFDALVKLDSISDYLNDTRLKKIVSNLDREISPYALMTLDQISGGIYATMETAAFQNITTIITQLADYLRNDPLLTYCQEHRVYEPARLNVWGTAYGTLGGSSHDGNAYGYDQSTGGTIIGVDRLYINRLRFGMFGTFGSSTYSTDILEKSKATDLSVGFYGRKELHHGYLLGTTNFGYTGYHTTRQLTFINQRAKSDRDAYFWSLHAERGLDLDSNFGRIQPFIGSQYIGNQFDKFTETGSAINLIGKSENAHSLRTILGARFSRHPRMVRGGKLETSLNFDWRYELLQHNKGSLKAQFANPNFNNFAGNGNYKIYGNRQNRGWLNAGFGSNWVRNNTRFTIGYNLGINGDDFFLHTGNIAFTYAR
ncbi:MAG: autotransporter outer membrane beta-barrel domain-containing protein [Planctomycetaceae bacterium]|nr:autotransporter outer membrane beta-barrel domain-containing protein [Planctomycetaceae bacterium]